MANKYRGAGVIRWMARDGKSPYVGENGNWWEWNDQIGDYVDTGMKATGTNFVPMGFWKSNLVYSKTTLGVPMVKVLLGAGPTYTVYTLQVESSKTGVENSPHENFGDGEDWKLVESAEMVFYERAYVERLQAEIIDTISLNADSIVSKHLRTSEFGARTEIDEFGIRVFNDLDNMNIRFGLKEGYAVMEYYDNDGTFLYDLGPNGISEINVTEEKWFEEEYVYLGISYYEILTTRAKMQMYQRAWNQVTTTYYRFRSKVVAGVVQYPDQDGKLFTTQNRLGTTVQGVFMKSEGTANLLLQTGNTGARIYPYFINIHNEIVIDVNPLYYKALFTMNQGLKSDEIRAYWNNYDLP